jgi:transmembrane sensor
MNTTITKNILYDFFDGRSSALQKQLIREWLKEPGSEEFYYQCLADWELEKLQYQPDTQQALEQFKRRLEPSSTPQPVRIHPAHPVSPGWHFRLSRLAIACSVFLCLVAGIYFGKDQLLYKTYATGYGETQLVELPDRSRVTLNANSQLKVSRLFNHSAVRRAWLSGEAFFHVQKQAGRKPFLVHTSDLVIEVLGTQFNVQQRRGKTSVVLNEGKVKLIPDNNTSLAPVLMQPGELVELSPAANKLQLHKKKVKAERYSSWRKNKLFFEHTPLPEVTQRIEDLYGVSITLADAEMYEKKFTGTLPTDNLDIILRSLSRVYGLEVIRRQEQILLK